MSARDSLLQARDWLGRKVACADVARHTPQPGGYVEWHEWAEKKSRTHDQGQCPTCGLFAIWKRRKP